MNNMYQSKCVVCGYETDETMMFGTKKGEVCRPCFLAHVHENWTRVRILPENLDAVRLVMARSGHREPEVKGTVRVQYVYLNEVKGVQRDMIVLYVDMSGNEFHSLLRSAGITGPAGDTRGLQVFEISDVI